MSMFCTVCIMARVRWHGRAHCMYSTAVCVFLTTPDCMPFNKLPFLWEKYCPGVRALRFWVAGDQISLALRFVCLIVFDLWLPF